LSILLADVGGTHVRFALWKGKELTAPLKLKAEDFENFTQALNYYLKETDTKPEALRLATAAWPDENGEYVFAEDRDWKLDLGALNQLGLKPEMIVNDFLASSYGILAARGEGIETLRQGQGQKDQPVAVLGAGTGLGLSYAMPDQAGSWRVQNTFGAHMLAAALTDEQYEICRIIKDLKPGGQITVFEDVTSGRGLPYVYQALCKIHDRPYDKITTHDIFLALDDDIASNTVRVCQEFLGLFMHTIVITQNALGGIYMNGGLLEKLRQAGQFNFPVIEKFFLLKNVPSVEHVLKAVPVHYVSDPFIVLRGLGAIKS